MGKLYSRANGETGGAAGKSDLWSLQPIRKLALPSVTNRSWARNGIDFFVLSRLEEQKLAPSEEADKTTLIRRLTFDLHGLPPSPDEVAAFAADSHPDAYERVVDRLLASARYGERWARHWLDVVRYTESQGFEYDRLRPNAWHYRDYVIGSFNQDRPYDLFVREQLAGDVEDQQDGAAGLIATSLLVCGPWDQAGNSQANATQKAITREEELEELVSVVSQSFLGLTVNCARCHDHKFDPIPQLDYYRIKSVFEGVRHGERPIVPKSDVDAHDRRTAPLKSRSSELEKKLAALKKSEKQEAVRGEIEDLSQEIEKVKSQLKEIPALPVSYVGTRVQPEPTQRLNRGDVKSPAETVAPGGLSTVGGMSPDLGLTPDAPEAERRRRFAAWVVDPKNPLPARVMANRIWHYHFGQGLVASPNDFGNSGSGVTHPELLDWLAGQLIASEWSMKALHRLIVCSATYRQSSGFRETAAATDADNRWLWGFNPKRLESEAIRDAMLMASGEINWAMGGPSFKPFDVIEFNGSTYVPKDKLGAEFNRRTVYRANVNSGKEPLLDALDCPDPSVKTPRRSTTATPLQALSLMNNSFVNRQAECLAKRCLEECKGDLGASVRRAYLRALGRLPDASELARASDVARDRGLWHVCWALFNSTEFLYVR